MGLRQQGKDRRRERILDAAGRLIASGGAAALSMRPLAKEAQVSVATLYNLYGSKQTILYALLDVQIDAVDVSTRVASANTPLDRLRSMIEAGIDLYIEQARVCRPLFLAVDSYGLAPGNLAALDRLAELGGAAIDAAMAEGTLRDDIDASMISRQFVFGFIHATRHWASGDLTHEQYRAQVLIVHYLMLLTAATDATRSQIIPRLERLQRSIR